MTKKYMTQPNKPSELFLDSLRGGGSHYMVCGHCGRTHYCPDSMSVEDEHDEAYYADYLNNALKEQEKDPDGVVIHYGCDFVMAKDLNGQAFVIECPCNGLYKFEQFIWNDRNNIRNYLSKRIELEYQLAEQEKTLNKLAGLNEPRYSTFW